MYESTCSKFSLLISFVLPSEEEAIGVLQSVLLLMGVVEQPAAKCPSTFGVFQVNSNTSFKKYLKQQNSIWLSSVTSNSTAYWKSHLLVYTCWFQLECHYEQHIIGKNEQKKTLLLEHSTISGVGWEYRGIAGGGFVCWDRPGCH